MKKLVAFAAICILSFNLMGCARIDVFSYQQDGYLYQEVQVVTDNPTLLEKNIDKGMLLSYVGKVGSLFGYQMIDPIIGKEYIICLIRKTALSDLDDSEPSDSVKNVKRHFFYYSVEVTENHPFNGYREEYETADDNNTLFGIIKNGIILTDTSSGQTIEIKPLTEEFPELKNEDLDKLFINFYWNPGSIKMQTSGQKVKIDGQTFYLWEKKFDKNNTTITYKYFSPNSVGWNITALIAGILTVGVIILVSIKKKKKPNYLDRYPYDPEKEADIYGNLPSHYNKK